MREYQAYYRDGHFVPVESIAVPEGSRAVFKLVEEQSTPETGRRQRAAFEKFFETMRKTPPLPPEFDEIINRRVNITRELEL
ncbi:hypothetical protein FACS1894217_01160 [Clostridia bacterium]|nr:hypothetical protein FACS1894217_01160 [Clostridia bacterium]